eukprot:1157513-Pelagomonas_calceolata.AAC.5
MDMLSTIGMAAGHCSRPVSTPIWNPCKPPLSSRAFYCPPSRTHAHLLCLVWGQSPEGGRYLPQKMQESSRQ